MDGIIRFNKLVYPDTPMSSYRELTLLSEANRRYEQTGSKKLFLSHKTGDTAAEELARKLAKKLRITVYMAEWDPNVSGDSPELPDYIRKHIETSNGFLVYANQKIATMWVGYEIGVAHATSRHRARVTTSLLEPDLPSVVLALRKLSNDYEIENWVRIYVC